MEAFRYLQTKFIQIKNELIPLWQTKYVENKRYGCTFEEYEYKGETYAGSFVVDYYWDLKKGIPKEIKVIDLTPKQTKFEIGKSYLVEVPYKDRATIGDYELSMLVCIKYEGFDSIYKKGKEIEPHTISHLAFDGNIPATLTNDVYEIRHRKPVYYFENGFNTEYEMHIKKLAR